MKDLIGKKFGRWTVISEAPTNDKSQPKFWCLCDCGKISSVYMYSLLSNKSRSCGCLQKETAQKVNYKHGLRSERLYNVWVGMRQRCNNPNHVAYHSYGGRGIKVCKEWEESYLAFREFMLSHGYDPEAPFGQCTIDRIDNDGDYCPENCRIVSIQEQQSNKEDVWSFIFQGKRTTISGASRELSISRSGVVDRLNKGWSLDKALNTPLKEVKTYQVGDKNLTIKEWANFLGTTDNTLRGRLQRHTMEYIVNNWTEDDKNKKHEKRVYPSCANYFTVGKETYCVKDWARVLGLSYSQLRYRLKTKTMEQIVYELRGSNKK